MEMDHPSTVTKVEVSTGTGPAARLEEAEQKLHQTAHLCNQIESNIKHIEGVIEDKLTVAGPAIRNASDAAYSIDLK